MKKLFSTIASVILLMFGSNANATVIKGSEFKAGLCSGKAYLNDDTGGHAECYVYRKFNNGFLFRFFFYAVWLCNLRDSFRGELF